MSQELRTTIEQQTLNVARVVIRAAVASLLLVTAATHTASAQQGAPGASVLSENRAAAHAPVPRVSQAKKSVIERRLEGLTSELNLSQVQRGKTRKILDDGEAESMRIWNDQKLAPIDRMVKLRSVRQEAQKQFRALLTKDQLAKYDLIYNREVQAYALPRNPDSAAASNKSQ